MQENGIRVVLSLVFSGNFRYIYPRRAVRRSEMEKETTGKEFETV